MAKEKKDEGLGVWQIVAIVLASVGGAILLFVFIYSAFLKKGPLDYYGFKGDDTGQGSQ